MKRITIDEFITMPVRELSKLIDDNSHKIEKSQDTGGIEVDMNGLSISDLVEKYNLLTIDQIRENVMKKLYY